MNKVDINRHALVLIYNRNKDYIVPLLIIFISFILFVKITIPSLNSLSTKQREVNFEKEKLPVLKNNLSVLNSMDNSTLNLQLSNATDAFPSGKNFTGVLNAISISANFAGVALGDYEFQVGDITNTTTPSTGLPNLQLTLNINGTVNSISRFINELYRTMPISEVSNIQIAGGRATINILFYYEPYLNKNIDETLRLSKLSKDDLELLKEISSWNNPKTLEQIQPIITTSPNASPSPLPSPAR